MRHTTLRAVALLSLSLSLLAQEPRLTPGRSPLTGRMNPIDRTWEDWQRRTGTQPPDFARLPSNPFLPDPLAGVKTPADWSARRLSIRRDFEHWVFGTMPPAPDNLRAVVTSTRKDGEATLREVRLEFGPGHKGTLRLELLIPPGPGPFPVFLTNHARNRPWVYPAVRRGYMAVVYHAADPKYGTADDSDAFIGLYPDYDFACLARWAWASMRAVDYLVALPEVDRTRIGIAGHSRGGKAALLSAAFDDRIGAVIASSGNTGECDPWRYTSDPFGNETIEEITGNFPHWFHPRLRFFAGREDRLPVDQNLLLAMVAPRGLMMYSSYSETQGNSFGFEQAYRSAAGVYRFLGKPDRIWLNLRPGEHATSATGVENFIDFLETVFARHAYPRAETWIHGYTFDDWRRRSGERIDAASFPARTTGGLTEVNRADTARRIQWALGQDPGGARFPAVTQNLSSDGWIAYVIGRPLRLPGVASQPFPFGDGLRGEIYLPEKATGKLPVVVWLHGLSYPTGYSRIGRPVIQALVKRGFAVVAFDQIGFGTRILEGTRFYERYPRWSLMGRMVTDTRAAIDAAAKLPNVDPDRIFLAGYDLGAQTGLFTAALETRVRALALVSGIRALRLDSPAKGIEGIRHYSHLHGLLPRFGFFVDQPARLPIDDDELLAMVAPRPVLAISPTHDRYAPLEDVRKVADAARRAWTAAGKREAFQFETPTDFNRLTPATIERVAEWLAAAARQ